MNVLLFLQMHVLSPSESVTVLSMKCLRSLVEVKRMNRVWNEDVSRRAKNGRALASGVNPSVEMVSLQWLEKCGY